VIRGLVLKQGMKINSAEHTMVNARLDVLVTTDIGSRSDELKSARNSSKATQLFAILCKASGAGERERFLASYLEFLEVGRSRTAVTLGASQDAAHAATALQQLSSHNTIVHTHAGYSWEKDYGPGGAWLRGIINWYDYSEKKHKGFKASNGRDTLLSGLAPATLQLRWGAGQGVAAQDAAAQDAAAQQDAVSPWAVTADNWSTIAGNVILGKTSWRNYRMDLVDLRATRAILLAVGRWSDALALFEPSPEGIYFAAMSMQAIDIDGGDSQSDSQGGSQSGSRGGGESWADSRGGSVGGSRGGSDRGGSDSGSRSGEGAPRKSALEERQQQAAEALSMHAQAVSQYMSHWKMACTWSSASFELMARALGTLFALSSEATRKRRSTQLQAVEEGGEGGEAEAGASSSSCADGPAATLGGAPAITPAAEWLPTPAELLEIAEEEKAWDVFMAGLQHPSLACAHVALKLGRWSDARQVAEGLLKKLRQPITRVEARRLLASCAAATGPPELAHDHLKAAASEAASAGYLWLETLLMRELRAIGGCNADAVTRAEEKVAAAAAGSAMPRPVIAPATGAPPPKQARRVMWDEMAVAMSKTRKPSNKEAEPEWKSWAPKRSTEPSEELSHQNAHHSAAGILDDGFGGRAKDRAKPAAEGGERPGEKFIRSKRSVKSINLPL
jgi:hypothetical protein